MTRLAVVSFVVSLTGLVAGCPGDPGPMTGTDAGRLDAPRSDTGGSTVDTGGSTDTGGTTADTGGTTEDTGTTTTDGGGTTTDAGGTTTTDAGGTSTDDGGTTATDAGGSTTDDGGVVVGTDAGRRCTTNADCGIAGSYCEKPRGTCSGFGTCVREPLSCPPVDAPVCGCDATTYPSECDARRMGVNVLGAGACGSMMGCALRPTSGCCFDDADCSDGRGGCVNERCEADGEGVCHGAAPDGECWEDDDCARGVSCVGASVCPCGFFCLVPDHTGRCGDPTDT